MGNFLQNILDDTTNLKDYSIEIYVVRHVKQDEKYKSWQMSLGETKLTDYEKSEDLNIWLKKDIKINLKSLNISEQNIVEYNSELNLNDTIARIKLKDTKFQYLKATNKLLIDAIDSSTKDEIITDSNFQIVKLYDGTDQIYFGYYGGIRKSTKRKKIIIIERTDFQDVGSGIINLGGTFDFVIYRDYIYVVKPRNFEYAYKFTDHINTMRDDVLDTIVSLPCFSDEKIKDIFVDKAKQHVYSRSIAQVSDSTLNNLANNYNKRCNELKEISEKLEKATQDQFEELKKENGILLDLVKLIDLDNDNRIDITEDTSITPLLHFFQDKIMKSFLTDNIKTILG